MDPSGNSLCFACGQAVGDPPRLNLLQNGGPCPTCAQRLLDSLPPALPSAPLRAVPLRSRTPGDDFDGELGDEDSYAEEADAGNAWEARYLEGGRSDSPFDDEDRPA